MTLLSDKFDPSFMKVISMRVVSFLSAAVIWNAVMVKTGFDGSFLHVGVI